MAYTRYPAAQLQQFCEDAFVRFGFSREESEKITDVLLLADLYGVKSHGVQRLVRYHKAIENGSINIHAKPEIVFQTPVSAVIDGHSGMGQLIGIYAMELAIEKAKASGMAFVSVRNSNHYGIAGYYTKMACDQGLMALSTTNSESIMVHTNSKQALLGTNPIAFAVPAEPYPFWFDAATTVVPRGRLEVYAKEDIPMPGSWAIDETGEVCHNAARALQCINNKVGAGGILPLGGNTEAGGSHKGYGFAMISEIFSAITSGGATSNHHVRKKGQGAGTCHSFIVIDPKIFGDADSIKQAMSAFLQELRDAKRADENIPIYTHGEKEQLSYERKLSEGIDVNINTAAEMVQMCDYLGMDSKAYLGDVDISGSKAGAFDAVYKE